MTHAPAALPAPRLAPLGRRAGLLGLIGLVLLRTQPLAAADRTPAVAPEGLDAAPAAAFEQQVTARLTLPPEDVAACTQRLEAALAASNALVAIPQFVLLVDRSPFIQAALLFRGSAPSGWVFVGAAPVSTGLPGRYEHFTTPLGVFDHNVTNPDYRAEGTLNKRGFRGYGRKGMRVYDFGWVSSPRGWGDGAMGELRLQMHSTDPDRAEKLLGSRQSEGCVRIPALLNDFIDRHALLDAAYLQAQAKRGRKLWVLRQDQTPTATPGRYMVVVDSMGSKRPAWSPAPLSRPILANVVQPPYQN